MIGERGSQVSGPSRLTFPLIADDERRRYGRVLLGLLGGLDFWNGLLLEPCLLVLRPTACARVEFLLLLDEEGARSSTTSSLAVVPFPFFRDSAWGSGNALVAACRRGHTLLDVLGLVGTSFQQSRQSHTRNLKQKASIFMHGWKQIHRFRKSILFLSECASKD